LVTHNTWIRYDLRPNCDHIATSYAAGEHPLQLWQPVAL